MLTQNPNKAMDQELKSPEFIHTLLPTHCVTLSKSMNLSGAQFPLW